MRGNRSIRMKTHHRHGEKMHEYKLRIKSPASSYLGIEAIRVVKNTFLFTYTRCQHGAEHTAGSVGSPFSSHGAQGEPLGVLVPWSKVLGIKPVTCLITRSPGHDRLQIRRDKRKLSIFYFCFILTEVWTDLSTTDSCNNKKERKEYEERVAIIFRSVPY